MTVTQTQSMQPASVRNVAVGRYLDDGSAAAITITVGFTPRYILVMNETSRNEIMWFEGMGDATGIRRVAAGTATLISGLGITVSGNTFIIGLDTKINASGEQIDWIATG